MTLKITGLNLSEENTGRLFLQALINNYNFCSDDVKFGKIQTVHTGMVKST